MYASTKIGKLSAASFIIAALVAGHAGEARAHCDTLSGPVIAAARRALDSGNVNHVLSWVQPQDEAALRAEFQAARAGRQAGGQVAAASDLRFFEVLVRIHRAGEGAPYTGIKPAGTDSGPVVPAADRALETGSDAELQRLIGDAVQAGVRRHFREALGLRGYDPDDVAAGRAFVKAYVAYTHHVEGLYQAATVASHHEHGAGEGHRHGHGAAGQRHTGHAGHEGHLPWGLAGVLGLGLFAETGWLVRRRMKG